MAGEADLIRSAGGDFALTLIAVLIVALVAGFFYMMRFIMENNTKYNELVIARLDKIVEKIGEYQKQTADTFCQKLKEHDDQAKIILDQTKEIARDLESRPCINGHNGK